MSEFEFSAHTLNSQWHGCCCSSIQNEPALVSAADGAGSAMLSHVALKV